MSDVASNKPKSPATAKSTPKHGCCGGGATSHENEPTAAQHADHGCCGDAEPAAAAHSSCGGTAVSEKHKHHRP